MTDLVAQHPAVRAWQEQLDALKAEERQVQSRVDAMFAAHGDEMAAWEVEREEALAAGRAEPSPPPAPDVTWLRNAQVDTIHAIRHHQEQRTQVLAAAADDLLPELREAFDRVVQHAAPLVEALDEDTAEARLLLGAYKDVLRALERRDRNRVLINGRSTRLPESLDVKDLVDAVHTGRDLLEPVPLALPESAPQAVSVSGTNPFGRHEDVTPTRAEQLLRQQRAGRYSGRAYI